MSIMELKDETAMSFYDLDDAEMEKVVGGATGVLASSTIQAFGNNFATSSTSARTFSFTLPDGQSFSFGFTVGYGFAY